MTALAGFVRARARRQRAVPWFIGTRVLMLLFALNVIPYFNPGAITGDVTTYRGWIDTYFLHGHFPVGDFRWQYPPGAAVPLLAPKLFANHLFGGSYFVVFFLMSLLADALVFRMLLKTARAGSPIAGSPDAGPQSSAGPSMAGPWAWTLGLCFIGPMAYGRYDLVVTALAVAALTVALRSEQVTSVARGVLIGIGTCIKAWPAALLFGIPRGRRGRAVLGAAALAAGFPALVLAAMFPHVLDFLTNQESRGIQIESVFGTPFLVGHWFGWSGHVENVHQAAFEYLGPGVAAVGKIALATTLAGFAGLLFWRWKARRRADAEGGFTVTMLADVALAATMVSMVTSRVLSPQYLIWALGLAAVCLARPASVMRVPSLVIVGAMAVTQLIFPLFYHSMRGGQVFSGLILVGRNTALVAATVLAVLALFRWAGLSPDQQSPDQPASARVSRGLPPERTSPTSP